MTTYAHVAGDQVDRVGLPTTGTLTAGPNAGCAVSGYDNLPTAVLTTEGWLPLVDEPPAYDPARQLLERTGYVVGADEVAVGYDVAWLPPSLTADRGSVTADGVDTAVVAYLCPDPDQAPAEVVFTVNGATATVPVADGVAELEVTATVPGPIEVTVDAVPGVVVTITAVEAADAP